MNCPACGYYNPVGSQTCFHCSLALPMSAGDAVCPAHPETKATGACSRCGTFGCGACLSQRGADWLCSTCQTRSQTVPWDEREKLGLWRAWWKTSMLMVGSPAQTCQYAEPDAPLGSSILFSVLSTLAGIGPTILVYVAILFPAMFFAFDKKKDVGGVGQLSPVFVLIGGVAYLILVPVFSVAQVLITAGVDHLALFLMGGNPRPYSVSVRAHALSMGPYIFGLLPVCGFYVFPIWSIVLRIIALMYFHKTTAGKAAAAVLVPMALCCGGFIALYASFIALAVSGRH